MTRWIYIRRISKLTIFLGGLFALLGLEPVIPARAASDWRKVTTDKQQINMRVPGMGHWTPGFWQDATGDTYNQAVAYFSKWRRIEDYGIHAQLTYQTRTRAFYYYTVREQVQLSFENSYPISFVGDIKTYDAKLGVFEYIHFSVVAGQRKRKCVGFARMFAGNKKFVYGQYCLTGDKSIDEDIIGPLIDSIDLDFQSSRQSDESRNSVSSSTTTYTSSEEILSRAEQGDARAQYTLGHNYQVGIGVQKDIVEAHRWYVRAAENGHSEAQYKIGYFYEKGRSVGKDLDVALNWYRKAAEQANPRAQFKIGLFYEQGWTVPKDLDEALKWYRKAAEQGHALAGMALGRLITAASVGDRAQERNIEDRLTKLKHLYDKGLITKEIYDDKSREILEAF